MLRLNAGFSRKVGEANYGSRGASVNVELEVESNLINDPEALTGRIRKLFDLVRRSVDEELNGNRQSVSGQPDGTGQKPDNGNDRERVRHATASQVRAIRASPRCLASLSTVSRVRPRFRRRNLDRAALLTPA